MVHPESLESLYRFQDEVMIIHDLDVLGWFVGATPWLGWFVVAKLGERISGTWCHDGKALASSSWSTVISGDFMVALWCGKALRPLTTENTMGYIPELPIMNRNWLQTMSRQGTTNGHRIWYSISPTSWEKHAFWMQQDNNQRQNSNDVGQTMINHPPNHHFYRWYKPFPNGWFIIVLPTLLSLSTP